ncbi:MAG: archaetidylserine decarboxylase [Firmicutes bacterium]|nr:archaetidylserine decarboxylase [Bacillota bacterium]
MNTAHRRWRHRVCAACLQVLPKRLLTTLAGHVLRSRSSRILVRGFAAVYRISLTDCEQPWQSYRSLAEFFARRLRPGLRALDGDDRVIASPVDGTVSELGRIERGTAIQAKGYAYAVSSLLADRAHAFEGGQYLTIYLSPSDYHRIHAPFSATVDKAIRIPGTLFPVNSLGSQSIQSLFTRNERVVAWLKAEERDLAMAAIGSFVVGSVQLSLPTATVARARRNSGPPATLLMKPVPIDRGEEFGWFEFGSTVVLLFGPDQAQLTVQSGERVKALSGIGFWRT